MESVNVGTAPAINTYGDGFVSVMMLAVKDMKDSYVEVSTGESAIAVPVSVPPTTPAVHAAAAWKPAPVRRLMEYAVDMESVNATNVSVIRDILTSCAAIALDARRRARSTVHVQSVRRLLPDC